MSATRSRTRARVSRLPLRLRLVAGFSLATFVVLLAAGSLVYWRVDYALDRGLDTELEQAAQRLDTLVRPDGSVSDRATADATGVAWQVLSADATVLSHGGPAGGTPMVTARQLSRVAEDPRTYNLGDFLPFSRAPYRVQVSALPGQSTHYLLVGVRRDHRDEALRELLVQLTVAGLGALLITAFVGDRLAHAALRPVERYRRRAAEIAAGTAELRLDVPADRDDEVTRLGHTFNDMLASLERALERERQFVDQASHELRTPITLLSSRIQLARRRPRSQAEHERILAELQVDLDRLASLAEQLLQLGSAAASRQGVGADLATAAVRAVTQRRLALPAEAGDLSVEVLDEPLPTHVADVELDRVLTNLLDNATTHGTAPITVTVDRPAPGWARLQVTDAGPGMPASLLATATQRFARAEEARSRPGAGLGLSLVAALVTGTGGELRLCHDGNHTRQGRAAPVTCDHGLAMTVTVLLPADDETSQRASGTG